MQRYVAIALALGDPYVCGGIGELLDPPDGAINRLRSVVDGCPCDTRTVVICTAGYGRHCPTVPNLGRTVSLAAQTERYVREHMSYWLPHLIARPLCWGTRNEVRLAIKIAQRTGYAKKVDGTTVLVASNLHHLLRIWLYMKLYMPAGWKFRLVRARHHFSLVSHLLEFPKFLRDVIYIYKVKDRLIRLQKARILR